MKLRLRLAEVAEELDAKARTSLIANAVTELQKHLAIASSTPCFVFGGGDESGLCIPPLVWPTRTGFSLCMWLKVDEKVRIGGSTIVTLFDLPASTGSRIVVGLQLNAASGAKAVVVKSFNEKGDECGEFITGSGPGQVGLSIPPDGKWHFLALALAPSSSVFKSFNGDITVAVDGRSLTRQFVLPNLASGTVEPSVGYLYTGASSDHPRWKQYKPYQGRMGPVHMVATAFSSEQFEAIYRLGVGHARAEFGDASLDPHVFASYNAAAARDGCLLNVAMTGSSTTAAVELRVDEGQARAQGFYWMGPRSMYKLHAKLLPNTKRAVGQPLGDMLEALGGVEVLLPLFALLRADPCPVGHPAVFSDLTRVFADAVACFVKGEAGVWRRDRIDAVLRGGVFPVLAEIFEQVPAGSGSPPRPSRRSWACTRRSTAPPRCRRRWRHSCCLISKFGANARASRRSGASSRGCARPSTASRRWAPRTRVQRKARGKTH